MKQNIKKHLSFKAVFAIAFIVLTMGIFFLWCVSGASAALEKLPETSAKKTSWDETKEYPVANKKPDANSAKRTDPVTKKAEEMKDLLTTLTEHTCVYMPGVKVKKAWDKYVYGFEGSTSVNGTNNNPSYLQDAFIYLGDGSWGFVEDEGGSIEENGQKLVAFANQQKEAGRDFVFLETAERCVTIPEKYEKIYGDHFYKRYNAFTEYLKAHDIDFLSSTEIINNSGIDRKDLFFKTDHHWLPQVGLWMTKEFAAKLNESYDYDIDLAKLDIENFDVNYCDAPHFGSIGIKLTEVYAEYDYLPILIPKYDTNLTVTIPQMGYDETGPLQDTIYRTELLTKDTYLNDPYINKYQLYAFGEKKLITIKNNNLHNGKRLLIIKKSMADCMTPFMSNIAEYVDIIDLRYFKGSLQKFIEETNPTTVVIVYSAPSLGNDDVKTENSYAFMD